MKKKLTKHSTNQYKGGVYRRGEETYSISDKNKYGEFVVIKMANDLDGNTQIVGTAIIKASDIKGVQQQIDQYDWSLFMKFEQNGIH